MIPYETRRDRNSKLIGTKMNPEAVQEKSEDKPAQSTPNSEPNEQRFRFAFVPSFFSCVFAVGFLGIGAIWTYKLTISVDEFVVEQLKPLFVLFSLFCMAAGVINFWAAILWSRRPWKAGLLNLLTVVVFIGAGYYITDRANSLPPQFIYISSPLEH